MDRRTEDGSLTAISEVEPQRITFYLRCVSRCILGHKEGPATLLRSHSNTNSIRIKCLNSKKRPQQAKCILVDTLHTRYSVQLPFWPNGQYCAWMHHRPGDMAGFIVKELQEMKRVCNWISGAALLALIHRASSNWAEPGRQAWRTKMAHYYWEKTELYRQSLTFTFRIICTIKLWLQVFCPHLWWTCR